MAPTSNLGKMAYKREFYPKKAGNLAAISIRQAALLTGRRSEWVLPVSVGEFEWGYLTTDRGVRPESASITFSTASMAMAVRVSMVALPM